MAGRKQQLRVARALLADAAKAEKSARRLRARGRRWRARRADARARRLRRRAARLQRRFEVQSPPVAPPAPTPAPAPAPTPAPVPPSSGDAPSLTWTMVSANVKGSSAVLRNIVAHTGADLAGVTEAWQLVRARSDMPDGYRLVHADSPSGKYSDRLERAAWHDCALLVPDRAVVTDVRSLLLSEALPRWEGMTHERRMLEVSLELDGVEGLVAVAHPNPLGRKPNAPAAIVESLRESWQVMGGFEARARKVAARGGFAMLFSDINVAMADQVPWGPEELLRRFPMMQWRGVDVMAGHGVLASGSDRHVIETGTRVDGRPLTADHPVLVWQAHRGD